MAHVSRADVGRGDPAEWQHGAKRAREARATVAAQLGQAIIGSDMTGSPSLLAQRVGMLVTARGVGDDMAARAAAMEVAEAAAALVVHYDLTPALKAVHAPADRGGDDADTATPPPQRARPAAAAAG